MTAILDNRSFTDGVLSTTMCLVGQTLNARPLTAVRDDPEDLTALTPYHFLLEQENASAPFMPSSERYHDIKKSFKKRKITLAPENSPSVFRDWKLFIGATSNQLQKSSDSKK